MPPKSPQQTSKPTHAGSPPSPAPTPNPRSSPSAEPPTQSPTTDRTHPRHDNTDSSPSYRIARLITEALSPPILVAGLLLVVAWHASDTALQALKWGLIAAAAASFLPVYYIIRGVRQGRWTDKHVVVHTQRRIPLLIILASTTVGTIGLAVAGAPRELLALIGSMVASLLVAVPITLIFKWGVSIHSLVAAGTVAALTVIYGPMLLLTCPVALAVAWARVRIHEHTTAQVAVGALIGACATGLLFPALI